jgi:hypothetical protein
MLIVVLSAMVIAAVVALPHLRRLHQRRQWRKLPPPSKRVETPEPVLRLPRRGTGDGEFEI